MKNTLKKPIATIVMIALTLMLATPVTAEAKAKSKTPKLNKTKITLTITKKNPKPTYKLKVKNITGKNIKWTSSNKKVAVVSKAGKVTAKEKGSAVITANVNGRKSKCKISVKDNRKKNSNAATHTHDYFKSTWFDPTCDLDGEVNYCCSICSDEYTEIIPATGHNYIEVSKGIESFTGKSFIKYQCTKCDRWYTQYPGPLIDYKKPHIHCHCGMDFNDSDEYTMHCFYAAVAGEINGHSNYNWYCCLV